MFKLHNLAWVVSTVLLLTLGCDRFPDLNRKDTGQARLKRINSADEWVEFFSDQLIARQEQSIQPPLGGFLGFIGFGAAPVLEDSRGVPGATDGSSAQLSPDVDGDEAGFSSTNIQEFGVDESDVVKTDGEHLYMFVGSQLRIIKISADDPLEEIASLQLNAAEFSNSQLYLNHGRVVAITQPPYEFFVDAGFVLDETDGGIEVDDVKIAELDPATGDALPVKDEPAFGGAYQGQKTIVTLIDVSDPVAPAVEMEWRFDGNHVTSRMIDGILHLVLSQYPYIPYDLDPVTLTADDVAQFIPAYTVELAGGDSRSDILVDWEDFYHPVDPDGYGITTVVTLNTNEPSAEFSSLAVMANTSTVYASREALYLTDPDFDYFFDYRETIDIHKLVFTDDGLEYAASGTVKGRLLNQFSLGEHEGYLRVATTTGVPWAWDENTSENHIFVMAQRGDELTVVGSIQNLAPGERIYSARFIGDKGFLVTFFQVDPLFTIDLSDPLDPRVAGELKVPGFSEYIHVLDEDHLLTLGRAADDDGFQLGLQLSIFDVSNFADPRLLASKQIGRRGSSSEAEYNHKAFSWYAAENLLAIPVNLYETHRDDFHGELAFSGVQVYHVTPQDGISLRGQIATSPTSPFGFPLYWGWARGLFVGDSVYATTEIGVQRASISDPNEVTQSLDLQGSPFFEIFADIDFLEGGF